MIEKRPFGQTGHMSSRTIFGSVCLRQASQNEADKILDLLFQYGVNHIDTAPLYGDAELRLGPWMKNHRDQFFLATKIDKTSYQDAREQFYNSLDRLQVDGVDLLQLHNLTDVARREIIMGPGGALEFLLEARDSGLTRFIGVTGHGIETPKMHCQSLERIAFDSVLLPYNYLLMKNPYYAGGVNQLLNLCRKHNIAVQTIKSIARSHWGSKERSHITWYQPLTHEDAINKTVHWVLGKSDIFLITVGDMQELPKVLTAASAFKSQPADDEMEALVQKASMAPLFD